MNTFLYVPPTRSPVDDKVHQLGKDMYLDMVRRHPIRQNETHPNETFLTIQMARKAKAYKKAREEQDLENMTKQFSRLSIQDDVAPRPPPERLPPNLRAELNSQGLADIRRREQEMEDLTRQFSRLTTSDVNVTNVFPLAR